MTNVHCMTPSEVTRELVDLVSKAGPDERRVIYFAINYKDPGHVSVSQLTELVAGLKDDEKLIQLPLIRRIDKGRREYGELHIDSDKRDFESSAVEEDLDAVAYRIIDALRGRKSKLLARTFANMRDAVGAALQRGAI